jgi:hypothetical protein
MGIRITLDITVVGVAFIFLLPAGIIAVHAGIAGVAVPKIHTFGFQSRIWCGELGAIDPEGSFQVQSGGSSVGPQGNSPPLGLCFGKFRLASGV